MALLTVPWVGLQYVIVVFPDHTHLLFGVSYMYKAQCVHKVLPALSLSKACPGKVFLGKMTIPT